MENIGNIEVFAQDDAQSDARGNQYAPIAPDLAAVVDAWPTLPKAIKAGILAMVRTADDAN